MATTNQRRVPIHRNTLFYDVDAFNFDIEIGKDYIEQDMGMTLVLYRVMPNRSQVNDVYKETDTRGVTFMPPVEFPCVYNLSDMELTSFDKTKNLGTYNKVGKLTFSFYKSTLEELGAEIKKGDYVGLQSDEKTMLFFVINSVSPNHGNKKTMYGTVPFYFTCTCSYVDPSEFEA